MTEIIAHVQIPTNWVDILFTAASILISIVAVFISVQTFRSQKEQNKNSVCPILNVSVGDYEDNIYVRLHNNGVGPAIITRIQCNVDGNNCRLIGSNDGSLVSNIPLMAYFKDGSKVIDIPLNQYLTFASGEAMENRALAPGDSITLIQVENPDGLKKTALRYWLKDCTVSFEYMDIYGNAQKPCVRKLDYFGRSFRKKMEIEYSFSEPEIYVDLSGNKEYFFS